jgi:hypothetical protein
MPNLNLELLQKALVLHPVSNHTFSTAYFAICRVGLRSASVRAKRVPMAHSTVSQRCHRIASFLRLAG